MREPELHVHTLTYGSGLLPPHMQNERKIFTIEGKEF